MRRPHLASPAALSLLVVVLALVTRPFGAAGAPSDPLFAKQWNIQMVNAPAAWARATGAGVTIAVVDTGVDKDHPELAGKLVGGQSWVDCPGAKPCGAWDDRNGHGTHVAGIAAAPIDGRGVVGVAPDARIMPLRVLDADGQGFADDIAAGIRWAADHGADVINVSIGGTPGVAQVSDAAGDDAISNAVQYALVHNVLVVIAAGNESAPICDEESLSGRGAKALCVGALDKRKLHSSYSNIGYGLDVVAPGGLGSFFCDDAEDVWSTYAVDQDTTCTNGTKGYETDSGTSMAAPHVAGVAALLAQQGVRGVAAADRIMATAADLGVPHTDPVYGAGLVDAAAATAPR
ncbi:MAG: hypothetical protein QOK43_2331 [Acidimicrobiaceae bacterium]|nr:hypothetical protein [Acidimicrobiaceae bacterium]